MNYYKIRTTGLRSEVYLTGTWASERNSEFNTYLRGTAYDGAAAPGDLNYLTNPGVGADELKTVRSVVEPTLQSFVFPRSTVEQIHDATSVAFEFVPIQVTASGDGTPSNEFCIVRFAEHRPFYDADRADDYALDTSKWNVTPVFESELDFDLACQDPYWGIAIVNDRLKSLLDKIIQLSYLTLDVELN